LAFTANKPVVSGLTFDENIELLYVISYDCGILDEIQDVLCPLRPIEVREIKNRTGWYVKFLARSPSVLVEAAGLMARMNTEEEFRRYQLNMAKFNQSMTLRGFGGGNGGHVREFSRGGSSGVAQSKPRHHRSGSTN
jgi:hypothetical protein